MGKRRKDPFECDYVVLEERDVFNFYVVSSVGGSVVKAKSEVEAWSTVMTELLPLHNLFVDRERLLKLGFTKMKHTKLSNVFLLS